MARGEKAITAPSAFRRPFAIEDNAIANVAEMQEQRQRNPTLLVRAHAQLRSAVAYLYWQDGAVEGLARGHGNHCRLARAELERTGNTRPSESHIDRPTTELGPGWSKTETAADASRARGWIALGVQNAKHRGVAKPSTGQLVWTARSSRAIPCNFLGRREVDRSALR